jgi:type II secretory pathway pseudopilin PulG
MLKKDLKTKGGYTIIETMIAVFLFLIVVTIGMGALLNANLVHRKSQDMRSIMDNLSFIMEDMSRNIRTGYNFVCIVGGSPLPSDVSTPNNFHNCGGIAFESGTGRISDPLDQWVYYISNNRIFKTTKSPYDDSSNYIQLTPDEINIDAASGFVVTGAEPGDGKQPFITIKLVGTITTPQGVSTPFYLQTSVSQRIMDM